ncbi:hypothetical protein DXG03_006739 [Asterophora parasitica]|uniref:CCHC-type domain-containing protein n=1 Tax=Asterophora parasitica TaxID=117018 RepID=A0A9P7K9F4_9AGAR|nr:hypothetical protein DXG03_006739 [Asterophora parasitica]
MEDKIMSEAAGNGGTAAPAAQLSTPEMESLLQQLIQQVTPTQTHVVPSLTRTGFARQVEFNCQVLNQLEVAKRDSTVIDSIIDILKERNTLLTLADKNPQVLELADKAKAFEAVTGGPSSGGSNMMMQLMMLQSLSSSAPNDRKRKAPSSPPIQPFRPRASVYPSSGAPSFPRPSPLFPSYGFPAAGGSRSGNGSSQSPGPCHLCGQYGHFRSSCPFNRR